MTETAPTTILQITQDEQTQSQPITDKTDETSAFLNMSDIVQDVSSPQQQDIIAIQELTSSFEEIFTPSLDQIHAHLQEIIRNQQVLIKSVKQQNKDLNEIPLLTKVAQIMDKVPLYIQKTKNIQKKMKSISNQTANLKKRTEKLQKKKK